MNSEREKNILRKLAIATGILAAALFLTAWLTEETSEEQHDLNAIAHRAESNLQALESVVLRTADTVLSMRSRVEMMFFFSGAPLNSRKVTLLVYEHNELLAWSGSDVTFASVEKIIGSGQKFMHLPNGWYRVLTRDKEKRRAVIFISVYSEYSYQNKFLVNGFNPALQIPNGVSLSNTDSKFVIHAGGEKLFGIRESISPEAEEKFPLSELLETSAIIMLLICFLCCGRLLLYRSPPVAIILAAAIIGARIAMVVFHFPEPLYQTALFSPTLYASSFLFNSPGDLLLNVLTFLVVALIFFHHENVIKLYASVKPSAPGAVIHLFLFATLLIISFAAVQYYASGLIINSKISFDLSNILELDAFSVLGFFMLALMMGFCFLIFRFAAEVIRHSFLAGERKKRYAVSLTTLIFFAAITITFPDVFPEFDVTDFAFLLALFFLTEVMFIRKKFHAVSYSIVFLVLFSLYSSVLISEFNSRKQDENLMALARKLETGRDHIAEHLFEEIGPALKEDSVIINMLADKRNDLALLRLQQIYFSGYWSKYNIAIAATGDTAATLTAEKLIREKSKAAADTELFFIEDTPENISYIVHLYPSEETDVYILFSEKFIQTEKGFPELYLSGDAGAGRDLENFSFARYNNGSLISSYGSYPYSSRFSFSNSKNEFEFIDESSYRHLVYKPNASTYVVVSKPTESALFPFTIFSYIISFFALLVLAISLMIQW